MVAHRMPKLNVATLNKINVANTSFKNRVSLCSSGWPELCKPTSQRSQPHRDLTACASQMLALKICATMPSQMLQIFIFCISTIQYKYNINQKEELHIYFHCFLVATLSNRKAHKQIRFDTLILNLIQKL